jgi:hypothetical protein
VWKFNRFLQATESGFNFGGDMPGVKGRSGVYIRTKPSKLKGRKLFHLRGKNANHYKEGGTIGDGYILVLCPEHPHAHHTGYVKRSHLIVERIIGRFLKPNEVVHHKGIKYPLHSIENRQDDSPENLQVMTKGEHCALHKPRISHVPSYSTSL